MTREGLLAVYGRICREADAIFAEHAPCGLRSDVKTRVVSCVAREYDTCCLHKGSPCPNLGPNGCTTRNVVCKTYLCMERSIEAPPVPELLRTLVVEWAEAVAEYCGGGMEATSTFFMTEEQTLEYLDRLRSLKEAEDEREKMEALQAE